VFLADLGDLSEGVFDAGNRLEIRVYLECLTSDIHFEERGIPDRADWMREGGLSPDLSKSIVAIIICLAGLCVVKSKQIDAKYCNHNW